MGAWPRLSKINNPAFTFLNQFGYDVVRLPRTGIEPLQVYEQNDDDTLSRLGKVNELFKESLKEPLPKIYRNNKCANVSGKTSGELTSNLGFSILGGILSSFGGSNIGIDSSYGRVQSISFRYNNVLEDIVAPLSVDQYMKKAFNHLNCSDKTRKSLEDKKVCLVTETVKSKSFTILPTGTSGVDVKLLLPNIQQIVGGNVAVTRKTENSADLTFEGQKPLVFGFKAKSIIYKNGYFGLETLNKPVVMKK